MPKEDIVQEKKEQSVETAIQRRFTEERKLFIWGGIEDKLAKSVTERLMYLDMLDSGKPIIVYLNTPGGSVTAGLAIYDTIKLMASPVTMVVTGMAASMGSIILVAAKKGSRYIYPHARVLIHQPLIHGRIEAPAVDVYIQAQEMEKYRDELNKILAEASGQSLKTIQKDTDRDFYLNAKEAMEYGLVDKIVTPSEYSKL